MAEHGFETRAIHAGQPPEPTTGAVVTPIYQTSTYAQSRRRRAHGLRVLAVRQPDPHRAGGVPGRARAGRPRARLRLRPGRRGLRRRALLTPGDHVLIPGDAYGGTYRLFAAGAPSAWGVALHAGRPDRPRRRTGSRAPGDPADLVRDADQPAAQHLRHRRRWPRIAHDAGALLVVDNTFASRYLQQPLTLGADVVVHSTTKYMGGHSDVVGGALVVGDAELGGNALRTTRTPWAPCAGPFDAWLVLRGLKTLGVRMDRHCSNARAVAELPARRTERVDDGALPRAARPPRSRGGRQADARLRRHGVAAAHRRGRSARAVPERPRCSPSASRSAASSR